MNSRTKEKGDSKNGKHNPVQSRSWKHRLERFPHRESPQVRRLPDPANGHQTTALGLFPHPPVAQDLVAGLEGP